MKKLICLIITLVIPFSNFFGQYKFDVSESNSSFNDGQKNSFKVNIYESTVHDVEKEWKKIMKDWNGKVDEKKHEFFADNVTFKNMGDNTFDTYAICVKKSNYIEFVVAVDLGGAYLSHSDHPDQSKVFDKFLLKFANDATKSGLRHIVKEEEQKKNQLTKEFDHLVKDKEKLENDIEHWKKSISKAEDDIKSNVSSQEAKKNELANQIKVVEDFIKKMNSLK